MVVFYGSPIQSVIMTAGRKQPDTGDSRLGFSMFCCSSQVSVE